MLTEQFNGANGIGCKADRQHQPLRASGLGAERLCKAIVWIAADRKASRQIIEQAEFLNELDIGFAGTCAVTSPQFE